MAKYRYLVEAFRDEFYLGAVKPDGTSAGSFGSYPTVEEAQAQAQSMAQSGDEDDFGEKVELVWKDPPKEWQPDAICVSQYLQEMYPDLPT